MMDSQMPRNSQRDGEPALVDKDKERIKELEKQIDKLNKVVEAYESMEFNVRELLSAVSESHKADALFELRNDCKALAELNNKG